MDIIAWLVVGLLAGLLASFAVGGVGYGLLGDIVIGIVTPFRGLAGTVFVAFVGAVVLLLVLRALRPRRA